MLSKKVRYVLAVLMSFRELADLNAVQSAIRVRSLLDVVGMCGEIEMCSAPSLG
jgi:hypothetical protein